MDDDDQDGDDIEDGGGTVFLCSGPAVSRGLVSIEKCETATVRPAQSRSVDCRSALSEASSQHKSRRIVRCAQLFSLRLRMKRNVIWPTYTTHHNQMNTG